MIWEKIFRGYVYFFFPLLILLLSLLYLFDGTELEHYELIEHRTEIGMIVFMTMTVYPLLYHSVDSINRKEWGRVTVTAITIALMLLIALKEFEVIKISLG